MRIEANIWHLHLIKRNIYVLLLSNVFHLFVQLKFRGLITAQGYNGQVMYPYKTTYIWLCRSTLFRPFTYIFCVGKLFVHKLFLTNISISYTHITFSELLLLLQALTKPLKLFEVRVQLWLVPAFASLPVRWSLTP